MRYRVTLMDPITKDHTYIFTYAPLEEGSIVQFGHDSQSPDGFRSWRVMTCNRDDYSL